MLESPPIRGKGRMKAKDEAALTQVDRNLKDFTPLTTRFRMGTINFVTLSRGTAYFDLRCIRLDWK
jgi:hypothetical protein